MPTLAEHAAVHFPDGFLKDAFADIVGTPTAGDLIANNDAVRRIVAINVMGMLHALRKEGQLAPCANNPADGEPGHVPSMDTWNLFVSEDDAGGAEVIALSRAPGMRAAGEAFVETMSDHVTRHLRASGVDEVQVAARHHEIPSPVLDGIIAAAEPLIRNIYAGRTPRSEVWRCDCECDQTGTLLYIDGDLYAPVVTAKDPANAHLRRPVQEILSPDDGPAMAL